MSNPHGCKDCKEYGRKLDQALAMRIEDSKSYNLDLKELRQENEDITEEKELWRKLAGQRGLDNEELKEAMVETKDGLTAVYMSGYNDCEAKMRVEANTLKTERDNYKEGLEVIVKQEEALSSVDYIEPATIARAHLKVLK